MSSAVNPKPKLLMATLQGNAGALSLVSLTSKFNASAVLQDVAPRAVTYLAGDEPTWVWVDAAKTLMASTRGDKEQVRLDCLFAGFLFVCLISHCLLYLPVLCLSVTVYLIFGLSVGLSASFLSD